jgi:hypothetical protein
VPVSTAAGDRVGFSDGGKPKISTFRLTATWPLASSRISRRSVDGLTLESKRGHCWKLHDLHAHPSAFVI